MLPFASPYQADCSLDKGDQVTIYHSLGRDFWWGVNVNSGRKGLLPKTHVVILNPAIRRGRVEARSIGTDALEGLQGYIDGVEEAWEGVIRTGSSRAGKETERKEEASPLDIFDKHCGIGEDEDEEAGTEHVEYAEKRQPRRPLEPGFRSEDCVIRSSSMEDLADMNGIFGEELSAEQMARSSSRRSLDTGFRLEDCGNVVGATDLPEASGDVDLDSSAKQGVTNFSRPLETGLRSEDCENGGASKQNVSVQQDATIEKESGPEQEPVESPRLLETDFNLKDFMDLLIL
jgi:hypothetical protein